MENSCCFDVYQARNMRYYIKPWTFHEREAYFSKNADSQQLGISILKVFFFFLNRINFRNFCVTFNHLNPRHKFNLWTVHIFGNYLFNLLQNFLNLLRSMKNIFRIDITNCWYLHFLEKLKYGACFIQ